MLLLLAHSEIVLRTINDFEVVQSITMSLPGVEVRLKTVLFQTVKFGHHSLVNLFSPSWYSSVVLQ